MEIKKTISLTALLILLALVLTGCSGGSGSSSSSDELVLSSLEALNSDNEKATFNDGSTYETRDFESDSEYLTSEEQEVSFLYKGVTYSGNVSYSGTEFTIRYCIHKIRITIRSYSMYNNILFFCNWIIYLSKSRRPVYIDS